MFFDFDMEGLALFLELEELALGALSLHLPSLFVTPDDSGVCASVSAWTGGLGGTANRGESLKTSGWPRGRHVCGAGVSVES